MPPRTAFGELKVAYKDQKRQTGMSLKKHFSDETNKHKKNQKNHKMKERILAFSLINTQKQLEYMLGYRHMNMSY